jgi:endonuclease/exonuclease/phosphatase (EEP) superfamily protein YafD
MTTFRRRRARLEEGRRRRTRARQRVGAVVSLAALGLLVVVVLGYGGPWIFELDLLAHFRLHLLWLAIPLGVLAVLVGSETALWRTLAAAVLAAAGLAPLWAVPAPAGEGVPVTVMTANVFYHNALPEAVREALVGAGADILVTAETKREVAYGSSALDQHYPHRLAPETKAPDLRTVIWSRFPIRAGTLLPGGGAGPNGGYALVEVAPGREVLVMGLHLSHVAIGNQGEQIAALGPIAADLPWPRIVMGDFNATPWSHAVASIEAATGTRRVPGVDSTWRGRYPTPFGRVEEPIGLPIDHILLSEGIGFEEIGTVLIPGSDHLAVRAVLRVPDR